MAPITNGRSLFSEIPTGYPEPGKHVTYDTSETIDLETVSLNGGVLVKVLYLSIDPYMRGRMRPESVASYVPAFPLGKPMTNFGVGKVLRSENDSYKAGDHVYGSLPFQEYFISTEKGELTVLKNEAGIPLSAYVGVAGMPGQTAYIGWQEFAKAKKGETIFVTSAAGPVGSFVVQLAKQEGLKIIASSGSEEKVAYCTSLGADVSFNYKTTSTEEILKKEGPIDIYWDHVGGEVLDLALKYANVNARFVEVGMITEYNGPKAYSGITNMVSIIARQISMNGFLVFHWLHKYGEAFYRDVPKLIKDGVIKFEEDKSYGLKEAGQGVWEVQTGKSKAKKVIVVAED
ncbi:alcohol dehydrogenase [Stereum hirsutum FP-91666 SS1]|uniref:alcohol dehydrogenase n=1 Tax=Stereum hirsutum (strain FP-91666) TaxID=721885 RepID=UPI000444A10B|nr:alcohol dehydrogenase [Stereum hirsutum FP-91666 SS1]EIM83940.1 alcohol dehydrogenase [Stereum hirsutum FP-91666 SS1]